MVLIKDTRSSSSSLMGEYIVRVSKIQYLLGHNERNMETMANSIEEMEINASLEGVLKLIRQTCSAIRK